MNGFIYADINSFKINQFYLATFDVVKSNIRGGTNIDLLFSQ